MKFKKLLAVAAASALTVSALAVSAFAVEAVTFTDGTGSAVLGDSSKGEGTRITWESVAAILPEGVNINDVYGVQFTFEGSYDETAGMGGSVIFSTKGKNWNGVAWGTEGANTAIVYDAANNTLTRLETEPFFTEADVSGNEGEYAQIVIDAYWGSGELNVAKLTFLDKDGNEVAASAAPAEETTAAEAPAEETTAAEASAEETTAAEETKAEEKPADETQAPAAGDTTQTSGNKGTADTGIEGVAVIAGVAVVAAGAVIVSKKRK